jgi:hypothetical protein
VVAKARVPEVAVHICGWSGLPGEQCELRRVVICVLIFL